ncbi:MAG: Fe-S oxidoreductase, partial [Bacteroidota bacterium]
MNYLEQIIFIIALGGATFLIRKRALRIAGNIKLGRSFSRNGDASKRLQTMLLVAFGQKKMFSNPLVGFMHFVIYIGF